MIHNYLLKYLGWFRYNIERIIYKLNWLFRNWIIRNIFYGKYFKKTNVNLNVGCGDENKTLVNIDLILRKSIHRSYKINPKNINNFVLSDAHHLPFKDKSFISSKCTHVLEHLPNPLLALKEIKRVTKRTSIICVPTPHGYDSAESHIYTWNLWTFKNILKTTFSNIHVIFSPYELIGICQQTIPKLQGDEK